ncbi:hypothetical protein [Hyalangium gracile]|uniref:hypothetical protein n=1 Tax=Hyalangium gracile TaxID=394092 RepID=UPI001CCE45F6|nr:hypothetical protein [Hyalangium gracile]
MADGDEPLNPRERLHQRRRERLLSVLPRIYAQQPAGSVVSVLVDAMAARLAELDLAIERVLRDRWVALAGGVPPFDEPSHPLEGLARLLNLESEPWERADWEQPSTEWPREADKAELFRRRVRHSAPVATRGSTTVRSVLTLGAAALDTELCPRLVRLPEGSKAPDTTLGLGVRPGTRASCPGCANPEASGRCVWDKEGPRKKEGPQKSAEAITERSGQNPVLARMLLTDSPLTPRSLLLTGLRHGETFRVRSPSLVQDRPEVQIVALEPVSYPTVQNLGSNGTLLFAGQLAAGEALLLHPDRTAEEVRPFEGYFTEGPALQLLMDPKGRALVRKADGTFRDVSDRIFFLQGKAFFDVSHFTAEKSDDPMASRFALLKHEVMSPTVEPGEVTWAYRGFTRKDVQALAAPEITNLLQDAPEAPMAGKVDITLEWWTRPPASFRLRVPQVPVRDAELRDEVLDLLRRSVERARAASVQVSVDFPEPPREETHPLGEETPGVHLTARATEDARMRERLQVKATAPQPAEKQPLGEGLLTLGGIFDVTRMDWSRFAP